MNLPRYLAGCLRAFGRAQGGGGNGWEGYFDLSKKGFQQSFLALALSLPFYYVCAAAVQKHRASLPGANPDSAIPAAAFFVILGLYAGTFVLTAYILCLVFDKQAAFRPWVIVRHWSMFFAALLAAGLLGLYLAGALPFMIVIYMVLGIYLITLAIDIRLAQRIAGFEWGAAVLTGCIMTAMGLTVLLMGVAQFAG